MSAPMVLLINGRSFAAAMAALESILPFADADIRGEFEQAITEFRDARKRWLELDSTRTPALLKRQA